MCAIRGYNRGLYAYVARGYKRVLFVTMWPTMHAVRGDNSVIWNTVTYDAYLRGYNRELYVILWPMMHVVRGDKRMLYVKLWPMLQVAKGYNRGLYVTLWPTKHIARGYKWGLLAATCSEKTWVANQTAWHELVGREEERGSNIGGGEGREGGVWRRRRKRRTTTNQPTNQTIHVLETEVLWQHKQRKWFRKYRIFLGHGLKIINNNNNNKSTGSTK